MSTPAFVQPTWSDKTLTWVKKTIESALDWVFSLTHSAGTYREIVRNVGLVLVYVVTVINLYDREGWIQAFQAVVQDSNPSTVFIRFGSFLISVFLHPEVIRRMLALIAPYLLVYRLAAVYLADIFEKDTEVASRFIRQAAFAEDYLTIRVRAGRLVESDQASPIVQIGGPGYVTVELDSAAVFERPDGSVHVIGPTGDKPRGREVIDDFERLRQCVDLRDIIDKQDVTARSRDGIIVTARDIQYSYSVYRGEFPKKTLKSPFPFEQSAVQTMVYNMVIPVWPGKIPDKAAEWTKPMPGKLYININNQFSTFIGQNSLSQFFSSIGAPEEEALRKREERLHQDAMALAGEEGVDISESPLKAAPFTSRMNMAQQLFRMPSFTDFMRGRGLQVNWIGVGTWETPSEIIPANHLKAWKTSQENQRLGGGDQIKKLYEDTRAATLIKLINDVPILLYYRLLGEIDRGERDIDSAIDILFEEYVNRLRNASQHLSDVRKRPPDSLALALDMVNALNSPFIEIGSDYFICTRVTSRPDTSIQGASTHTVEIALSKVRLTQNGYQSEPVQLDFGNQTQASITFGLDASQGTVETLGSPQKTWRFEEELYTQAVFQVLLLPGSGEVPARIEVIYDRKNLAEYIPPLNLPG
jgi:hypothetical protein